MWWAPPNQLKAWIDQKCWPSLDMRELFLPDCLWTGTLASWPPLWTWVKHQFFQGPQKGNTPSLLLAPGLWTRTGPERSALWGLQLMAAELASLPDCVSRLLITNLYTCTAYWFCFSRELWLIHEVCQRLFEVTQSWVGDEGPEPFVRGHTA